MPGGQADPSQQDWTEAIGAALAYRAVVRAVARKSASALTLLWDRMRAGKLTDADLAEIGATTLAAANTQASMLADVYLAHVLGKPTIGLVADTSADRLSKAITTAASPEGTNPADALDRLGRSEPLRQAQVSLHDGMTERQVAGWTRETGGSPCQICAKLANGQILSPATVMWHHPGCSCVQRVVNE